MLSIINVLSTCSIEIIITSRYENIFYYLYKCSIRLFGILNDQVIIRDFLVVSIPVLVPFAPAPFAYYSKEYMVALVIRPYLFVLIWTILVK